MGKWLGRSLLAAGALAACIGLYAAADSTQEASSKSPLQTYETTKVNKESKKDLSERKKIARETRRTPTYHKTWKPLPSEQKYALLDSWAREYAMNIIERGTDDEGCFDEGILYRRSVNQEIEWFDQDGYGLAGSIREAITFHKENQPASCLTARFVSRFIGTGRSVFAKLDEYILEKREGGLRFPEFIPQFELDGIIDVLGYQTSLEKEIHIKNMCGGREYLFTQTGRIFKTQDGPMKILYNSPNLVCRRLAKEFSSEFANAIPLATPSIDSPAVKITRDISHYLFNFPISPAPFYQPDTTHSLAAKAISEVVCYNKKRSHYFISMEDHKQFVLDNIRLLGQVYLTDDLVDLVDVHLHDCQ